MFGFSVKDTLKIAVVIAVIALSGWGIYSVIGGAKLAGAVDVIQKQGVINEEENRRAVDALATSSVIATESDNDFNKRMQRYWSSKGNGEYRPTKSVPNTKHVEREHQIDGQFSRAEREAIRILQATGVLPEADTELLPCEPVGVSPNNYQEGGQRD